MANTPTITGRVNVQMSLDSASPSALCKVTDSYILTMVGTTTPVLTAVPINGEFPINLQATPPGPGGMAIGTAPKSGFVALYILVDTGKTNTKPTTLLAVDASYTPAKLVTLDSTLIGGYTDCLLISVWPTDKDGNLVCGMQKDRAIFIAAQPLFDQLKPFTRSSNFMGQDISRIVPPNAKTISGFTHTDAVNKQVHWAGFRWVLAPSPTVPPSDDTKPDPLTNAQTNLYSIGCRRFEAPIQKDSSPTVDIGFSGIPVANDSRLIYYAMTTNSPDAQNEALGNIYISGYTI